MYVLWEFAKKGINILNLSTLTKKVGVLMIFKRSFFGFSVKDVNSKLKDYEHLIELQKRDIEYLKRDNAVLKNTISFLNKERDETDKIWRFERLILLTI